MTHSLTKPIHPEDYGTKYLWQDGTPAIKDAAVNGSSTPVDYLVQPGATEVWLLYRLLMVGLGTGTILNTNFITIAGLSTGIGIKFANDTTDPLVDILDGLPIKTNDGLAGFGFDARQNEFGATAKSVSLRYSFFLENNNRPILLSGFRGDRLVVTINDNLSTLTSLFFRAGMTVLQD